MVHSSVSVFDKVLSAIEGAVPVAVKDVPVLMNVAVAVEAIPVSGKIVLVAMKAVPISV
jgi:hypothetical protein